MELDLSNFNIRKTKPIILGNAGLPENVERYTVKGEGILGINLYRDDEIKIVNIEGSQEMELTFFNDDGKNENLVGKNFNKNADFIKYILKNSSEKNVLLKKLKKKKVDLDNLKSLNYFDQNTESGTEINLSIEKNGFAIFAAPQSL